MRKVCRYCQHAKTDFPAVKDATIICHRFPDGELVGIEGTCGEFMNKEKTEKKDWKKPEVKELLVEETAKHWSKDGPGCDGAGHGMGS